MPHITAATRENQVYEDLKAQIADGSLAPGQLIPSGRQLSATYGVSARTCNRALHRLAAAKLAVQSARGTVVTRRLVMGPQARLTLTGQPQAWDVTVTGAAYLEHAPDYVRPILGLEPDPRYGTCAVIRREEVHTGADGKPVLLQVEWIPPGFAGWCPELAEAEPLPAWGGAVALIRNTCDLGMVEGRFSCEARPPSEDRELGAPEAGLLNLAAGEWVLGCVWVWYTSDGAPVGYTEMTLPGGAVIETWFTV